MKVTALLITYNHEPFLAKAIESALKQVTDFEYEILIAEDCSTDRSRDIAKEFADRNPERVRLSLSQSNVGTNRVILRALGDARGEYIALLDGDDYWSSDSKLQQQARFLDVHKDCSMCYHAATTLNEDGSTTAFPKPIFPARLRPDDILRGHLIATCSVMFRKAMAEPLPPWFAECIFDDWPLYFLLAQRGRVGYLDEDLGVYRKHGGGAWTSLSVEERTDRVTQFYKQMANWAGPQYAKTIDAGLASFYYASAVWNDKEGNRVEAERYARLALAHQASHVRAMALLWTPLLHRGWMSIRRKLRP
jgi:glycosyltransferase involved in cell wall biosynthesis